MYDNGIIHWELLTSASCRESTRDFIVVVDLNSLIPCGLFASLRVGNRNWKS